MLQKTYNFNLSLLSEGLSALKLVIVVVVVVITVLLLFREIHHYLAVQNKSHGRLKPFFYFKSQDGTTL